MNLNFHGAKDGPLWLDMWNTATIIDFQLAQAKSDSEMTKMLMQDDGLEIHLRRIAAYIYERRTGDKVGAAHVLAVTPPGAACDVAPTWLIAEATTHSRQEFKRAQQVGQAAPLSTASPGPGGRGGGRGRFGADGQQQDGAQQGGRGKRGRGRGGRS